MADFGPFSHALLVGNFGDGRINAFDFVTGAFLGQLSNDAAEPIEIDGLWGLHFLPTGPHALFFASGPDEEEHGLFGFVRTQHP